MALVHFLNLLLFQKPPFRVQHYGIRLRAQLFLPGVRLRQRAVQPLQHAVDAGIGALHLLRGLLYPVQHHPVHKKPVEEIVRKAHEAVNAHLHTRGRAANVGQLRPEAAQLALQQSHVMLGAVQVAMLGQVRDEPAAEEVMSVAEGMRAAMQMGEDTLNKLQDMGIETINVLKDDEDGFGTRAGFGNGFNSVISASPIKPASGWAAAPAEAKEFTILLSKGLIRRVGLILKGDSGVYDQVAIYKTKKDTTPLVICPLGQMVYNVIDEVIFSDQSYLANRHYKLIKLNEDASELKLYISAAMELNNDQVIHPKRLQKAIVENVGPFPPQSQMYVQDQDLQQVMIEAWDYVVDWYLKCFDYFIENEGIEYIFSITCRFVFNVMFYFIKRDVFFFFI